MTKTLNYAAYHGLYLWFYDDLTEIFGDGCQYVFRFNNGFGASVVKHRGSYGHEDDKWELAVIKFNPEIDGDWSLTYETDITDDVIGWLNDDDVNDLLDRIKNLDKDGKETIEDETEQD